MQKISQIESIGVRFTELLHEAGIDDQQQLLEACSQKSKCEQLAKQTGINTKLLNKWSTQADLARIDGIGEDYANLLEHCGVLSVTILSQFNAEKLFQTLQQMNIQTNYLKHLPSIQQVETWIKQATKLPVILER
ncbi:TfoX C-terminal domain (plasmid) [Legionella adelaidensis]|uniref:TfoX C-terminal domain n=1 Tax=Legionella adelaidensis TaxID=45056 RepID=A0A0W0R2H2_9GAMM|nr:DUF4332 domain-containing protein [Legionella adelaidensis]KTC65255.1 hypothetical protein Lade_1438 [Legionella adelaidensis]VEH86218.1 TfoX C-terminal domain [Legionella adelaidensis]